MHTTDQYESMLAETVILPGYHADLINAYFARPLGAGPFPAMVLVHHMPGWDEFHRETARRLSDHGFVTVCPNLYIREGHGTPEDIAARVRGAGGISDEQVLGDIGAALEMLKALPYVSGKVGVMGMCSGGRHAYLCACRIPGFSAVVDCWGGRLVMAPDELTPKQPVAPLEYTKDLIVPLLGIFGNEDHSPTPEQVNQHEELLRALGKEYEFHRYDGAGHAFFNYFRPGYRAEQAMDGWNHIFSFLDEHLKGA
jgi:carboxymethylenebutenolidase